MRRSPSSTLAGVFALLIITSQLTGCPSDDDTGAAGGTPTTDSGSSSEDANGVDTSGIDSGGTADDSGIGGDDLDDSDDAQADTTSSDANADGMLLEDGAIDDGPVETCEPGLWRWLEAEHYDPPAGGSDRFSPASEADRTALDASIRHLVGGDPVAALADLTTSGFRLCRGTTPDHGVYLWHPTETGLGRPLTLWRAGAAREVIIEAPHAVFDLTTGEQAVTLFDDLQARGLVLSGTHRCASNTASTCDGTTSACSESAQAYPVSDPAHNPDLAFHTAHVALSESLQETTVVSLHGFGQDGVSLSDGTQNDTSLGSPVAQLGIALAEQFAGARITTCSPWSGANLDVRMCGQTNVQGRHLNGIGGVCTEAASSSSGRFVHMEQSRTVRGNRSAVADAFRDAFLLE